EPQKPVDQKKWDFNDALRKQGISQVKSDLDQAKLYKKGITQESITQNLSNTLEALSGDALQEATIELGIAPITDMAGLSYEALLTQYVDMEVQQTQLIHAMHAAKLKDPKSGRELASQAVTHANTIKAFVSKVVEHPEFKLEVERLKKEL